MFRSERSEVINHVRVIFTLEMISSRASRSDSAIEPKGTIERRFSDRNRFVVWCRVVTVWESLVGNSFRRPTTCQTLAGELQNPSEKFRHQTSPKCKDSKPRRTSSAVTRYLEPLCCRQSSPSVGTL